MKEALTTLKAAGISTAIETNGTSPRLPELFELVDAHALIMDCKHHDPETHQRFTGLSNQQSLRNLSEVFAHHPNLLVRIPLFGGFNASGEDRLTYESVLRANGLQVIRT